MRTIIMSLQDAVKTELKDIFLLDKQDKIIFVYPKGKDSISIPVHTALSQIKSKIEFYEIPDETADKQDILIYFAYLAGNNPNTIVIDVQEELEKLSPLGITRYPDFKSMLSKKATAAGKSPRGRKTRVNNKENISLDDEKISLNQKKEETPSIKPINKKVTPSADIDDLRIYLQKQKTETYNPAVYTMGIYEAVKNVVLNQTSLLEELKKTIIIDKEISAINQTLEGKWREIIEIVTQILRGKGKLNG